MLMIGLNESHRETHVVPKTVEQMADVLLSTFGGRDPQFLRVVINAPAEQCLRTAVENWLLNQLDLEDPVVAEALFRLFVDRLERKVEQTQWT